MGALGHWADYIEPCSGLPVRRNRLRLPRYLPCPAFTLLVEPYVQHAYMDINAVHCVCVGGSCEQGVSRGGSAVFSEVDCFEMLMRYATSNTGCCKVLHHPRWGSGVYPASIVSTAPLYEVESVLGKLSETMS